MAAEPQDFEPEKLTAGVTWKWKKTHSDYPASEWTLTYNRRVWLRNRATASVNPRQLSGQTAEAMAAQALASAGFSVSVPIFAAPAFDLVAKWGRAIHAIQVKSGALHDNQKSIQWMTHTPSGFYTEEDCSYFALLRSREMKSGGFRFRRWQGRSRSAQMRRRMCCISTEEIWTRWRKVLQVSFGNTSGTASLTLSLTTISRGTTSGTGNF